MNSLLAELGRKLADRWLSALLLPGLLYVAAAGCGVLLRHGSALDPARLTAELGRLGDQLSARPAATLVTIIGGLLAATAAGLVAQGLAAGVRRAWTSRRPRAWVAQRREKVRLARSRDQTGGLERYLPARATAIGDRFRLVDERVDAQYGLSVVLAWPRLWLLLPETVHAMISGTYARYQSSTETTAWGLLTALLGVAWWPALPVGVTVALVGYRRGLKSGAALADLVEAAIDTHQHRLAETLGIDLPHGRITPAEGLRINDILNKRA